MVNNLKTKFTVLFLFLSPLFFTCTRIAHPERSDRLAVAMDLDMPGYFTFGGVQLGYHYELLKAYADAADRELVILSENTPGEYHNLLAGQRLDMIATVSPSPVNPTDTLIQVYATRYVLLSTRRNAPNVCDGNDLYEVLRDKSVMIPQGFTYTETYDTMLDSVDHGGWLLSSRNVFELFESLSNGKYDFLICEKSEAFLGCSLIRNLKEVYEFEEEIPVYMVFDKRDESSYRTFSVWLNVFRETEKFNQLHHRYFEKGMASRIISDGLTNKANGAISAYDDLFRKIGGELDLDWRLISAIAYHESKFNAYLVSPKGATGIMQVMPATARAFDVPGEDLMDPEENTRLAARLIRKIERSVQLPGQTDPRSRLAFTLACYNGGIGHVSDARRLAAKYGANPDSWTDVARYLRLKADETYAGDEVVACGTFKGADQTIAFVNNVLRKYDEYKARYSAS